MAETTTKSKELYEFRKQVKALAQFRGRGTELISLYISPGYPVGEVTGKLRDEFGQAANIKSAGTRKNVQGALEKIMHFLKGVSKPPENGIAVFCGNISETEGKTDIQIYSVVPPLPLHTQFYRCESTFVLEPLEEMFAPTGSHGLVVVDGSDAAVGLLRGKSLKVIKEIHNLAPSKVHKGGQCVHADSFVPLEDGRVVRASELFDSERARVASLDLRNQRAVTAPIVPLRTSSAGEAVEITTYGPRLSIEVTPGHGLFVLTPEGFAEKPAREIQAGDYLLAARRVVAPPKPIYDLSYQAPVERAVTPSGRLLLRLARRRLGLSQERAAKAVGSQQMSISDLERGEYRTIERLYSLLDLYSISREEFLARHTRSKTLLRFPTRLSFGLAQFVGYFAGDGSIDGNRLKFYDDNLKALRPYRELALRLFRLKGSMRVRTRRHGFGTHCAELKVYNKWLPEALRELFPEVVRPAYRKEIPVRVLQAPDECLAGFLCGLFDAEGSVTTGRIALAVTSRPLILGVQAALFRFGILTSVYPKKAQYRPQFGLEIADLDSLRTFARRIGFSSPAKRKRLRQLLGAKKGVGVSNRVPIHGRLVSALAAKAGLRPRDLYPNGMYLTGKRGMNRRAFKRLYAKFERHADRLALDASPGEAEAQRAALLLEQALWGDLVAARVHRVRRVPAKGRFLDFNVPGLENFIANGLVVHNSAARYARIREEAYEDYFKRIGEAMGAYLQAKDFRGFIVGGPGPVKENFLKEKTYNYQLKMVGMVDTSYSGEFGLREVLEKAEELISEQESVKERKLLEQFMADVARGGPVAYGVEKVRDALERGQASKLLISESLDEKDFELECSQCHEHVHRIARAASEEQHTCGGKLRVEHERDVSAELIDLAESKGTPVEMISTETPHGQQFAATFKAGAFLRYR